MTATKIQPGDDTHLTLLMAPHSLNLVTGADRAALLAYGRDVFAAARDSKCPAQPVAPVLDDRWKARMLDGRAIERDEMGLGDHPELPQLDEGMKPRGFFAALGLELTHTMAEDQLDWEVLGVMSEAVNWTDWQPTAPQGDGWKLVAIFDTEDGPAAWWLRELAEAEDGTTTIRNLQAEIEKLKARMARVSRAGAAPAAVAGPAMVAKFTDESTADPVEKARRYLKAMADEAPNGVYFFDDGYPRRASSLDAQATLAVLERLAAPALEAPAAPTESPLDDSELEGLAESACQEALSFGVSSDSFLRLAKTVRLRATAAAPQAPAAPTPWLPYLTDRADGVRGHYAIARHNPAGYREVWNLRTHQWASASDEVLTLDDALAILQKLAMPTAAPAAPAVDALSQAVRDVLAERQRQIDVKGMTSEHDDEHSDASMALAAACYALGSFPGKMPYAYAPENLARFVGWGSGWFKLGDPGRNLVKSAALAIAELERRYRAAAKAKEGGA